MENLIAITQTSMKNILIYSFIGQIRYVIIEIIEYVIVEYFIIFYILYKGLKILCLYIIALT